MKTDIHPTYHDTVQVTCACGNTFETGSTAESIEIEICAACHPFFTGTAKLVDTAGRVDKFKAKVEKARVHQEAANKKKKPTKGELVEVTPKTDTTEASQAVEEKPDEK